MANKHRSSKLELDRDSGFSDASSGYLSAVDRTEFEDVRSRKSTALPSLVPGSYQSAAPIMNNVVLKQSGSVTPAVKPWDFSQSLEMVPQAPVVLLQPLMPSGNCTSFTPASHQSQSKNYIPILNSFLKIAPHPAHGTAGDLGMSLIQKNSSGHRRAGKRRLNDNQSPSLSLKQDISETSTAGAPSADASMFSHCFGNLDSSPNLPAFQQSSGATSPFSVCSDGYSSPFPEPSLKDAYASSDETENIPASLSPSSSKRKRFCNTYNILNRSGLLGITMRTKELIRQNKRSQAQLRKLQAQTELFLEAMRSRDPQVWAKLQLTIQNSPYSKESKEDTLENQGLDIAAVDCM